MPTGVGNVVSLTQSWELNESVGNMSGTKVFITQAALPGGTATTLPELGDSWDSSNVYSQLTCSNIQSKYLNDNTACGLIYTCSYTYNTTSAETVTSPLDLPASLSVSGDLISFIPRAEDVNKWYWSSDGKPIIDTSIPRKEVVMSLTLQKYVLHDSIDEYIAIVSPCVNTLNDDTFMNIPKGLLMFLGVDAQEVPNNNGTNKRKWLVQLRFSLKNNHPAGTLTADYGWNRFFRKDKNNFEIPLYNNLAGNIPFRYTDFDTLI